MPSCSNGRIRLGFIFSIPAVNEFKADGIPSVRVDSYTPGSDSSQVSFPLRSFDYLGF